MPLLLSVLLSLCWVSPMYAQGANISAPPELSGWVPFLQARHPTLRCPLLENGVQCLWPGLLELNLDARGGRFSQEVVLDQALPMPLPGGAGAWPQQVQVDGRSVAVIAQEGRPVVPLQPGQYRITGTFAWNSLPPALPMSPLVGHVSLTLEGQKVPFPQLEEDGALRLSRGEGGEEQEERLELVVTRKITDALPAEVETVIALRAAGAPRELRLPKPLLEGSRPVSLEADLPVRLSEEGALVLQLRPGTFTVTLGALHEGPLTALKAPAAAAPWPEQEYWSLVPDETYRSVRTEGPVGVDPARVPLPEGWDAYPTFVVNAEQVMKFEELRRGQPKPPPHALTLTRTLWLDMTGEGFTVQDRLSGQLQAAARLDTLPPMRLGAVEVGGEPQVVTQVEGRSGVELRSPQVALTAQARIDEVPSALSVVGWTTEVSSVQLRLHLPPGFKLLAVSGVDGDTSALLDRWTLFDLFFVLVVTLAVARLAGRSWGLVALLGLTLTRHLDAGSDFAPEWAWVGLLLTLGLLRVVPAGGWKRLVNLLRWGALLIVYVMLVVFATDHIRVSIFPALEHRAINYDMAGISDRFVEELAGASNTSMRQYSKSNQNELKEAPRKKVGMKLQQDPGAVVQTGEGVPNWMGSIYELNWNSAVTPEQDFTLYLLGPWTNGVLGFLRVLLLLALVLRLTLLDNPMGERLRALLRRPRGLAPALGLFCCLTSGLLSGLLPLSSALAQETPSEKAPAAPERLASPAEAAFPSDKNQMPALLQELEQLLIKPPACAPACVTVPQARLFVFGDALTLDVEVHAAARTSWKVPGPAASWMPEQVLLNGSNAAGVARLGDGFMHVRLEPGVQRLMVTGKLPLSGALTLQWGLTPQRVAWQGEGWELEGLRADGTVEQTIKLVRRMEGGEGINPTRSSENLTSWLEVHRWLVLGLPWTVRTEVVRRGPVNNPVSLKVPLLPGESVNAAAFQVQGGQVLVTLNRDETVVSWESTLPVSEKLVLKAPTGVPWVEEWTLLCQPTFACQAEGVPPTSHLVDDVAGMRWRVWPGEEVQISVSRPEAVSGRTTTLEQVHLRYGLGQRLAEASLELELRSSQGGQLPIVLPEGARLRKTLVEGVERTMREQDGKVMVPLTPGSQKVQLHWQQPFEFSLLTRLPAVGLGTQASNVQVSAILPAQRWILGLFGPMWGPVPLFWSQILVVLLLTPLLSKIPKLPVTRMQWLLLGLGLVPLPAVLGAVVVLWFVLLVLRRENPVPGFWRFNVAQLSLFGWTFGTMGVLYAAIHVGLLEDAPSNIMGLGSNNTSLHWYVDRVSENTPAPALLSLPLWTWRVLMLLWSLWLASTLLKWLPWAWESMTVEGILRAPGWQRRVQQPLTPAASSTVPVKPEAGTAAPEAGSVSNRAVPSGALSASWAAALRRSSTAPS
ncbi:MAG: hypothetical protein ACKO6N_26570, partial [Myxococcota bacterium]